MITWTGSNIVQGVGATTGTIVLFLVTFTARGEPRYTPVVRAVPIITGFVAAA